MKISKADGRAASIRSPIRWAGSKRQLVPALAEYWSDGFDRYVEPFCGSCALFFHLTPAKALLSDANEDLVHFLRMMKSNAVAIWKSVLEIPISSEAFALSRSQVPSQLGHIARAARFYYLNRNCFNGLYRTDRAGRFNVPFSGSRTGALPSMTEFMECGERLSTSSIHACDFGRTLTKVRRGDFVYLDPPFYVSSRRVFRHYGPRTFCDRDIDRLGRHLDRIDSSGAKFVLSFAACDDIKEIAATWNSRRVRVRRQIAGFGAKRRFAYELLITNMSL